MDKREVSMQAKVKAMLFIHDMKRTFDVDRIAREVKGAPSYGALRTVRGDEKGLK